MKKILTVFISFTCIISLLFYSSITCNCVEENYNDYQHYLNNDSLLLDGNYICIRHNELVDSIPFNEYIKEKNLESNDNIKIHYLQDFEIYESNFVSCIEGNDNGKAIINLDFKYDDEIYNEYFDKENCYRNYDCYNFESFKNNINNNNYYIGSLVLSFPEEILEISDNFNIYDNFNININNSDNINITTIYEYDENIKNEIKLKFYMNFINYNYRFMDDYENEISIIFDFNKYDENYKNYINYLEGYEKLVIFGLDGCLGSITNQIWFNNEAYENEDEKIKRLIKIVEEQEKIINNIKEENSIYNLDANNDGLVDAVDATILLGIYAYNSTGYNIKTVDEYFEIINQE